MAKQNTVPGVLTDCIRSLEGVDHTSEAVERAKIRLRLVVEALLKGEAMESAPRDPTEFLPAVLQVLEHENKTEVETIGKSAVWEVWYFESGSTYIAMQKYMTGGVNSSEFCKYTLSPSLHAQYIDGYMHTDGLEDVQVIRNGYGLHGLLSLLGTQKVRSLISKTNGWLLEVVDVNRTWLQGVMNE
jgi:hypothetical protein